MFKTFTNIFYLFTPCFQLTNIEKKILLWIKTNVMKNIPNNRGGTGNFYLLIWLSVQLNREYLENLAQAVEWSIFNFCFTIAIASKDQR